MAAVITSPELAMAFFVQNGPVLIHSGDNLAARLLSIRISHGNLNTACDD